MIGRNPIYILVASSQQVGQFVEAAGEHWLPARLQASPYLLPSSLHRLLLAAYSL